MKYLFLFMLFAFQLSAQDTICISVDRAGRIADTIEYFKQYKPYAEACDSALASAKKLAEDNAKISEQAIKQRSMVMAANEALLSQMGQYKALSSQWEAKAFSLDKTIQRIKKRRRSAFGVFGGLLAGLAATTITLIIVK